MEKETDTMDHKNGFTFTKRDCVLRAWLASTELVRDYQEYAEDLQHEDRELALLFNAYAEEEALHAAEFLKRLRSYEK